MAVKIFRANDNKIINGGGSKIKKTVMNLCKNDKSRNLMHLPNIRAIREPSFLILILRKFLTI